MTETEAMITPLDAASRALWVVQQLVPDQGVLNGAWAITLDRPLRRVALQKAVNWLVDRHPVLRTSFQPVAGVPVRREHPAGRLMVPVDLRSADRDSLQRGLREYAALPFDITSPPLIRVGLVTVADGEQLICVVAHQLAAHGRNIGTLLGELGSAYVELERHGRLPFSSPAAPRPRTAGSSAIAYWRDHTAGFQSVSMQLTSARAIGERPTFGGDLLQRELSGPAAAAVQELRRRCRVTDAIVMLAAYYLLLRRHGAARDSMVGVMADPDGTSAAMLGHNATTLPLRVAVPDTLTFAELVGSVTHALITGLDHSPVSFEEVVEGGGPISDGPVWWRARMFRHIFNFRPKSSLDRLSSSGMSVREIDTGLVLFDLELIIERGEAFTVKLAYSTEVHDAAFAERFLDRFESVLCAAADAPERTVGDFDLRTSVDRALVRASNDTVRAWPAPHTVLGMALAAPPDATAVWDDHRTTSYQRMLQGASAVRRAILGHSSGRGTVVGIAASRSAAMAATMLGVWSAGASYLPLDPAQPRRRLIDELEEVGCRLLIGAESLDPECSKGRVALPTLDLDRIEEGTVELPEPDPGDAAYVIFTSGSTGRPKGVWLTHANLSNVVRHFAADLDLGPGDGTMWLTTIAFDVSTLELCLPFATGGRVVVAPDEARAFPERLLDIVERADVRLIQATPTTWRLTAPAARDRLAGRIVLCGGEPLSPALARGLTSTGAEVLNVYGPTETTIWSTAGRLRAPDAPITIGKPIANTSVWVLDDQGREVPVGMTGELCIGGAGVAIGYHDRPELTAERFVDSAELGRYYRTGDRALWQPDGGLRLLGRSDRQVKLRGNRIEPAEVEHVLEEHPEVSAAAVVLRGDPAHDGVLVAFVVARARPGLTRELWTHAAARLPTYCLPGRIVIRANLPITDNGKVDMPAVARLPEDDATESAPVAQAKRTQPRQAEIQATGAPAVRPALNDVEAGLVELWRDVLGSPTLDRDAHFFLAGGNSLQAVRLAAAATGRFGVEVTMSMVFRAPTPAALAAAVAAHAPS